MTKNNNLMVIHKKIEKLIEAKQDALPKDFNQTRFLQNCMTVLADTKDIQNADAQSVARTMLKGAFLGLDFFNKECYAVIFGGKVQFLTDYKGEIKLAKKYSLNPIKDIYAKLVRKGDEFSEEIKEGQQIINFKPQPFNNNETIGAFAVCLYKDGSMLYEAMSKEEIEGVRNTYSKMKEGQAWTKSTGEMYKKTVLRRLCKLIELDFDRFEQQEAWQDGQDSNFNQVREKKEVVDPFADYEVVEDMEEVEEEKEQAFDEFNEDIPEALR